MPTPPYQQKAPPTKPDERHEIMPTLFGDGYGLYEVRKESFVASFVINTVILALLIWLGTWTATHAPEIKKVVTGESVDISPYIMQQSKTEAGGGGGGGSHDVNPASKGSLPKFSKEQFTPPSVTPPDQAKLTVPASVVVPQEIKMAQGPVIGDPLGALNSIPSNGVGIGGGIGSGSGGGDAVCAKIISMVRVGMALTLCSEASVSKDGWKSRGVTSCRSVVSAICGSF